MSVDNTRFNLAWLSIILFIAAAVIFGIVFNMPLMACVGIFFLGTGAVTAVLGAIVGKMDTMLIGGGAALAVVGLVLVVMNYSAINPVLLIAAIVLVAAIAGIIAVIAKSKSA